MVDLVREDGVASAVAGEEVDLSAGELAAHDGV